MTIDVRSAAMGTLDVPSLTGAHPVYDPAPGTEQFYGIIDDVRQLVELPTDEDVLERAMREMDPDDPALAFYLKFSEGTGTTAFDSTASAVNGTLSTAALWVGLEGGPELAGVRKKRVWGEHRQVAGVLVDAQRLVYQVNDGETQSIVPTQGGYRTFDPPPGPSTYDGDFANIYDWTPVAGHYATQLSRGLVRFHSDPTAGGTVVLAFDVEGDVDPDYGYTANTAEISRNMVVRSGVLTLDDVDTTAVAEVAAARPDEVGIVAGGEAVSLLDMLNRLAAGIDGWWTFSREGLWTPGVRAEAGVPEIEIAPSDLKDEGPKLLAAVPPAKQWVLTYAPYEVTMDLSEVSGSLAAAERGKFTQETRQAPSRYSAAAAAKHGAAARVARGETLYVYEAAARRELARRIALDEVAREIYTAPLVRGLFQHRVGQSVSLYIDQGLNLERVAQNVGRSGRGYLDLRGGYVNVPSPPSVGSGNFTVMAWVRVDTDSPSGAYCIMRSGTGSRRWFLGLRTPSEVWGQLKFITSTGGSPSTHYTGDVVTAASGWTHVAVTVDRTTLGGEIILSSYINGQPTDGGLNTYTYLTSPGAMDVAGDPLEIGGTASGERFNGGINDVRLVVGSALTAAQVAAVYAEYQDLAAGSGNWRMDDASGSVAADSAGSADGVVVQPADWKLEASVYTVRRFVVGGYDESTANENATLYLWGAAWEHS